MYSTLGPPTGAPVRWVCITPSHYFNYMFTVSFLVQPGSVEWADPHVRYSRMTYTVQYVVCSHSSNKSFIGSSSNLFTGCSQAMVQYSTVMYSTISTVHVPQRTVKTSR